MGLTNFPNGITSYGVPVMGGSGTLPLLGGSGKTYFVDPANGSDDNEGDTPTTALDTVGAAYAKCVDKQGDVVYLLNDGNTSGSSREATLPITWSKDNTHLVGLCAPTMVSQRSRITPVSGAALTANAVINLTGNGCIFSNVAIQHWGDTNSIASRGLDVGGDRNYLNNVMVVGIGHANAGDEANAVDLTVSGSENTFENCVIGVDSVARGGNVANCCIRLGAGGNEEATRNVFKGCICQMYADDTEPIFIKVGAAFDTQRWNLFEDCNFINTGTSTLDAGISHTAAAGKELLKNCAFYGVTDVTAADSTDVYLYGVSSASVVDVGLYKGVDIA